MTERSFEPDVIIIGGGPAGLSAALTCSDLGLSSLVLERQPELGGQLLHIYNAITNYPGVLSTDGKTLRDLFVRQLQSKKVKIQTGADVVNADLTNKSVVLADGTAYTGGAILLATGVSRRRLGIVGETEFLGNGVLESGVKSMDEVAGKTVVIVGGGDAAVENAVILSGKAAQIVLVHRAETFRARRSFMDAAAGKPNIKFITGHELRAIVGTDRVRMVELEDKSDGEVRHVNTDAVLIRVGVNPNSGLFAHQLDLDESGYVRIDAATCTGSDGIFAIGDLANPRAPFIATATGQGTMAGAMAARLIRSRERATAGSV